MINELQVAHTVPYPGLQIFPCYGIKRVSYVLGKEIASGGYSVIFEGIDSFENNLVLKVFKPLSSACLDLSEKHKF